MKYVRAVVLVAASLLIVGSGSASAKVCSGSGTGAECAAGHGKLYTGELKGKLKTGTQMAWTSGFISIFCNTSEMSGKITDPEKGTGVVTSLSFSACNSGLGACSGSTSASVNNPWPVSLTTTTAPNGTAEVSNFTTSFNCGGVSCKYQNTTAGTKGELVIKGGAPATFVATNLPANVEAPSSGFCSATSTSHAEYTLSTPGSIYLT